MPDQTFILPVLTSDEPENKREHDQLQSSFQRQSCCPHSSDLPVPKQVSLPSADWTACISSIFLSEPGLTPCSLAISLICCIFISSSSVLDIRMAYLATINIADYYRMAN